MSESPEPELDPEPLAEEPEAAEFETDPDESDGASPLIAPIGFTLLCAVGAVVGGLLRNPEPTGTPVFDTLLTIGFIVAVVVAGRRAGSKSLLWFAALCFVFTGIRWWLIAPTLALVVVYQRFNPGAPAALARRAGPLACALAIQAALRFDGLGFTSSSALLAALAVIPVLVSHHRAVSSQRQRTERRALVATAGFAVIASALAMFSVLAARPDAEAGIDSARRGLDLARTADQDGAIVELMVAAAHFGAADDTLSAFWAAPGRLVPIVAQHARAVETAAAEGAALARAAGSAAGSADIDQVRVSGGRLDLDLLATVGTELDSTLETIERAVVAVDEVSVPWLVEPLDRRLREVRVELDDARDDLDLAAHATSVVPGMLGGDGARHYLVVFTTPAEARELGGFIGNWALLRVDDGEIDLDRSGRVLELNEAATLEGVADPSQYPERYLAYRIERFFQNLTGTPDFPTVAAAAAEIFPQMGGRQIDGVMAVDPFAIAALLELSGPVFIDGLDGPLTGDNVVEFLLEDQYELFDDLRQREEVLGTVAETAFTSLLSSEIPGPERLGAVLGPVARQDRLLFTTFDTAENEFLDRVFLRGALPELTEGEDWLSVVHDAAVNRKLDTWLSRTVDYQVAVDPETGEAGALLTITMRNDAPATLGEYVAGEIGDHILDSGEPLAVGNNFARLSVYTGGGLREMRIDGEIADATSTSEYGLTRYLTFVEVPLGGEAVVTFDLAIRLSPGDDYALTLASQPLVEPAQWRVSIARADRTGPVVQSAFALLEDTVLEAVLTP